MDLTLGHAGHQIPSREQRQDAVKASPCNAQRQDHDQSESHEELAPHGQIVQNMSHTYIPITLFAEHKSYGRESILRSWSAGYPLRSNP
ncbi:hypothetical protein D9M69_589690 [compost metagenome]